MFGLSFASRHRAGVSGAGPFFLFSVEAKTEPKGRYSFPSVANLKPARALALDDDEKAELTIDFRVWITGRETYSTRPRRRPSVIRIDSRFGSL